MRESLDEVHSLEAPEPGGDRWITIQRSLEPSRAPDVVPISWGAADSGTTAPWTAKNLIRKRNRPQGSEYYDDDDGDDDDDDDDDDAGARRGSNFAEPRGFWNHARPAALPPPAMARPWSRAAAQRPQAQKRPHGPDDDDDDDDIKT